MQDSIKGLSESILLIEGGNKINKIFQINKKNVIILPYAFDRKEIEGMVVNRCHWIFQKD